MVASPILKENFQRFGFVHVPSVFSADEVAGIRADLEDYFKFNVPKIPDDVIQVVKTQDLPRIAYLGSMNCFSEVFKKLGQHERLIQLAESLVGCPVRSFNVNFRNSPPGSDYETYAHQDSQGPNIHPCIGVTLWMSLGNYAEIDGCLRYLKGSHFENFQPHLHGPQPNPFYDRSQEVAVPTSAGDLIAHTWFTVHRSEPNRGTSERWALMLSYVAADSIRIGDDEWRTLYTRLPTQAGETVTL